jgi:hypothetical protein
MAARIRTVSKVEASHSYPLTIKDSMMGGHISGSGTLLAPYIQATIDADTG